MYEDVKKEMIRCGVLLDRYQLISLSGGNLSARVGENRFVVTPSGMMYEDMSEDDCVVVDEQGHVIEGHRKPSVDTAALLAIFKGRPDVNAIIHTHQPYTNAIGLVQDEFPCVLTTLANVAKGSVPVCPYVSAASEQMGHRALQYLKDCDVVIMKNHGLIALGKDLKTALYVAVYTEEAAKTYVMARSMSEHVAQLNQEQIEEGIQVFNRYGQK
jgi:L-ribulose-5-phosphate 4-epimerase